MKEPDGSCATQFVFTDLVLGEVVKCHISVNSGTVGSIRIQHEPKIPFTDYAETVQIWYAAVNDFPVATKIPIEFTVTSEMLNNRAIGLCIDCWDSSAELEMGYNYTPSKLDGTDGDVMVELPEYYVKFKEEGTKQSVRISERFIPGYQFVPKSYVGAFHGCLKSEVFGSNPRFKSMWSVVSLDPMFRGGTNEFDTSAWDLTSKTMLGHPMNAKTNDLEWFCTNSKNERYKTKNYSSITAINVSTLHWFCAIEYATFDYTAEFNSEPTTEGFKQGGIGKGVVSKSFAELTAFYEGKGLPPVAVGATVSLGNTTGTIDVVYAPSSDKVSPNSYRGVENMCSCGKTFVDGVRVLTKYGATEVRYQHRLDPNSKTSQHSTKYPPWQNYVQVVDFSICNGFFAKTKGANNNYTGYGTNYPTWSEAYTSSRVSVGESATSNNNMRTLLTQWSKTSFDTGLDQEEFARLNYTLPI